MDLKAKVCVVTGASRGLGESIAQDLAAAGAHVVLAARDSAGLERVAAAIRTAGGAATIARADMAVAEDRGKLLAAAEAVGPIEVLVNNAGVEHTVSVVDQTPEEIEQQITVNLLAPLQLTRAVLPLMIARKRGVVVMISSMSGKGPTPYNAIYAATKYGLNGFTSSLRIELKDSGVHVGVVCPGFVAGGMWASTGLAAPSSMKEVSTADVCAGVRKVIDGATEVLVTRNPMRPALAFAQLFPSLEARAMGWMGITKTLRERADVTMSKRLR